MSRANKFIFAAGVFLFLAVTALSFYRINPKNYGSPEQKLKADIESLGSALKVYESYAGAYPTQEQGLSALVAKPAASPVPATWYQMMRQLPVDPWGQPYVYRRPPVRSHQPYDLFSTGPDKVESPDDVGNWLGEAPPKPTAGS